MKYHNKFDSKAYKAGKKTRRHAKSERKVLVELDFLDERWAHETIKFQLNTDTPMLNLKKCYAKLIDMPLRALRFLHYGYRLGDKDTPESIQMRGDGDVIDVFLGQPSCEYERLVRRSRLFPMCNQCGSKYRVPCPKGWRYGAYEGYRFNVE